MHVFFAYLAADYALELHRDAAHQHLVSLVTAAREPRISPFRRGLARALVAVSRSSAAAVRRLDACLADDLGRSLARIDGA